MNDLLNTLEAQTADVTRGGADGTDQAIKVRHTGIVELCDLIKNGALISAAELERIRSIARGGAELLDSIREAREGLRENLRIASRQQSFSKCLLSVLYPR